MSLILLCIIIYKIVNKTNGKLYVGQTIRNLEQRWKDHVYHSKRFNFPLCYAIRKYGKGNFELSVIEECTSIDELNNREKYWISYYCSNKKGFGYNADSGGKNSIPNEETKRKMSEAQLGRKHSEETKKKIGRKGHLHPFFGKIPSKETRQKMSESSRKNNPLAKLSKQDVRDIKTLLSKDKFQQKEIAKMFGINPRTISAINVGKIWSYIL